MNGTHLRAFGLSFIVIINGLACADGKSLPPLDRLVDPGKPLSPPRDRPHSNVDAGPYGPSTDLCQWTRTRFLAMGRAPARTVRARDGAWVRCGLLQTKT